MNIRHAQPSDAQAISRVHISSWKTTYRGLVPDHVLDNLDTERNSIRWQENISRRDELKCYLIAENSQRQIIGFATGGPNRTENTGYNGELYAIYLTKESQRKGVGKALLLSVARWLSDHNYTSMLVWVLAQNPAKYFYEAMGGIPVSRKKLDIGNSMIDEVSYGWKDIKSLLEKYQPK
jgi:GNAT superfamily N-acetyltransferase